MLVLELQDPAAAMTILDYLPEGVSVLAVIVTVILFLRQQKESGEAHRSHQRAMAESYEKALERQLESSERTMGLVSDRIVSHLESLETRQAAVEMRTGQVETSLTRLIEKLG